MERKEARRQARRLVSAGLVALAAGTAGAPADPGCDPAPTDLPVVDVHAHVFNLDALPVERILRRRLPPWMAGTLADWLLAHTDSDPSDCDAAAASRVAGTPARPSAAKQRDLTERERQGIRAWLNARVPLGDPDFSPRSVGPSSPPLLRTAAEAEDECLVYLAMREAGFLAEALDSDDPLGECEQADLLERPSHRRGLPEPGPSGADRSSALFTGRLFGGLRFLRLLRRPESAIAAELRHEYCGVDLFVHHLMDLDVPWERHGGPPARHDLEERTCRARELGAASGGRLLGFHAFDPVRAARQRADVLDLAKRAIAEGAAGIKVYPPSGYRATGNADSKLDEVLEQLYEWACKERVPLFTHCTPEGFEVEKDSGKNSDPEHWAAVLGRHPELILCFGHAGGGEGWFTKQPWGPGGAGGYAERVVELAREHEHVYLGVGYLDEILDAVPRKRFRARLEALLEEPGAWSLGDKLLYGTDWSMIVRLRRRGEFPSRFDQVFTEAVPDSQLRHHRVAFFAGNAASFLRLPRHLERMRDRLAAGLPCALDWEGLARLETLNAEIERAVRSERAEAARAGRILAPRPDTASPVPVACEPPAGVR